MSIAGKLVKKLNEARDPFTDYENDLSKFNTHGRKFLDNAESNIKDLRDALEPYLKNGIIVHDPSDLRNLKELYLKLKKFEYDILMTRGALSDILEDHYGVHNLF